MRVHADGRRTAAESGAGDLHGPLREGDAIGVALASGDIDMGATGTVTHIDDDRVYAFGHPFYNLGPAEFPMTRAYVYTILPSLLTSFKISSMGDHDRHDDPGRPTAIAGHSARGPRRADDRHARALVGWITAGGPRLSARSNTGSSTDQMPRRHRHVAMFNRWRRTSASSAPRPSASEPRAHHRDAATWPRGRVHRRFAESWRRDRRRPPDDDAARDSIEPITLERLDVTITTAETPRRVTIERVSLDDIRARGPHDAAQDLQPQLSRRRKI